MGVVLPERFQAAIRVRQRIRVEAEHLVHRDHERGAGQAATVGGHGHPHHGRTARVPDGRAAEAAGERLAAVGGVQLTAWQATLEFATRVHPLNPL
ncbi:hypothetical protein [Nocardia sp. CC227C]|uniref:hypothetical protein n=1 Tax=Nocardia sp. CC227C TaxID=3044562 RepID=UPI00278BF8DB|nr:hypothetical protein [Nocardia sp. CC227C]